MNTIKLPRKLKKQIKRQLLSESGKGWKGSDIRIHSFSYRGSRRLKSFTQMKMRGYNWQ